MGGNLSLRHLVRLPLVSSWAPQSDQVADVCHTERVTPVSCLMGALEPQSTDHLATLRAMLNRTTLQQARRTAIVRGNPSLR